MAAVPAVLVAVLTGWFTVLVFRQFQRNHRQTHFFWTISLAFSCLASLAYAGCLAVTPHAAWLFAIYYLLGAMWMPSIMGLGSLALVFGKRTVNGIAMAVGVIGIIGSVFLLQSPISASQLTALNGGAGTGIISNGLWLPFLITLNSFGAVAVFLVAVMSAWRTARHQAPARFLHGNLWLAGGILIISAAGSAARFGWPQMFWITMLIGWAVTFAGYRLLTPVVARTSVAAQVS